MYPKGLGQCLAHNRSSRNICGITGSFHLFFTGNLVARHYNYSPFTKRDELMAPSHTIRQWQSQNSSPGPLPPESKDFTFTASHRRQPYFCFWRQRCEGRRDAGTLRKIKAEGRALVSWKIQLCQQAREQGAGRQWWLCLEVAPDTSRLPLEWTRSLEIICQDCVVMPFIEFLLFNCHSTCHACLFDTKGLKPVAKMTLL